MFNILPWIERPLIYAHKNAQVKNWKHGCSYNRSGGKLKSLTFSRLIYHVTLISVETCEEINERGITQQQRRFMKFYTKF